MSQTARFRETLRRLTMIDEGFVDEVELELGPAGTSRPGSQDRGATSGRSSGNHRVVGGMPAMERYPGDGSRRDGGRDR